MMRGSWGAVLRQIDQLYNEGTSVGSNDGQLLSRFTAAREESELAFEAIVQRHGPMVLNVCRRVLGDHHSAEDAFQATFLVLARRSGSIALHPNGSLGPWLHQVACRTARKARVASSRRQAREKRVAKQADATVDADQQARTDNEPHRLLHEEVARLPEKYRAAVVLCYFDGLTHDQAAESLHWPVGTVRGYLARARDILRARLIRRGIAPVVAVRLLSQDFASATATVSPALIGAVKHAISRGSATTAVATLVGSIARGLAVARLARVAVMVMILVFGVGGAALVASYHIGSASPKDSQIPAAVLTVQPASKASVPDRVDTDGRQLPKGAVARLGTIRFNHGSDIKGVAFALGDNALLSVGRDGITRVWDTASGAERYTLGNGAVHASSFAVSPDGTSLMTFEDGGVFRQWDLATGRERRRWDQRQTQAFFSSMAFSPDGKTVATAGLNDRTAYLWDAKQPGEPRRLEGDERSVWDIAFSPDGRMVATAAMDGIPRGGAFAGSPPRPDENPERGSVRLWDTATGKEIRRPSVEGCHPRCLAFSPDGAILAAAFSDSTIRFYDAHEGKESTRLRVEGAMQGCLAFSPDGHILASGTYPNMAMGGDSAAIHLWDVIARKEIRQFPAHDMLVTGVAFSPDGKTLASSGSDVAIRLWDVATGREINPSSAHRSGVTRLIVSPADGSIITGGYDCTIRRWDPATGSELGRVGVHSRPIHDLAIAPGGQVLLSSSLDGIVQLWDVSTGREVHRLSNGQGGRRAAGLAFAPDGRIATAGGKIWEVATGLELAMLQDDQGKSFIPWLSGTVLFTPDGKGLISAGGDARLWDANTGRKIRSITAPDLRINSIALSPDGRFLAGSIENDRTIRLWHVASGREVERLVGHQDLSYALAFSPDSRLMASGAGDYTRSTDRSMRVWELATGRELRQFDWHRAGITSVAFLPDGRRLASSSADATAIIWDIATTGRGTTSSPLDLGQLWSDLRGDDAAVAYRAIWRMTAAPERVVPFLAGRLKAVEVDDSTKDTTLGPIASGETLRRLRAIAVLEKIGTPEARQILERLASGLEGARETRDAKATLRRLERN